MHCKYIGCVENKTLSILEYRVHLNIVYDVDYIFFIDKFEYAGTNYSAINANVKQ